MNVVGGVAISIIIIMVTFFLRDFIPIQRYPYRIRLKDRRPEIFKYDDFKVELSILPSLSHFMSYLTM